MLSCENPMKWSAFEILQKQILHKESRTSVFYVFSILLSVIWLLYWQHALNENCQAFIFIEYIESYLVVSNQDYYLPTCYSVM